MNDTIAAIATPLGGGVSIIRVSGAGAWGVARRLWRGGCDWQSHRVYYGHVAEDGEILDEALLILMKAPRSYTAEDVAELHCHGGRAVTEGVLAAALRAGARPAEPGEFTKRAFLNGRIDLTQAEAVGELIQARTAEAGRAALRRLGGGAAGKAAGLAEAAAALLARIEAGIDFPEEIGEADYMPDLRAIERELAAWAAAAKAGRALAEGVSVAIIGRPNVGKSTLMNRLTGTEAAIVTDEPGATRDVLRETVDVGGLPVRFADTAGIREAADEAERQGVARARAAAQAADLTVFVTDGDCPEDAEIWRGIDGAAIAAVNKADAGARAGAAALARFGAENLFELSAKTGDGVDALLQRIRGLFANAGGEGDLLANARQRDAAERALDAARSALAAAEGGLPADCVATDLRDVYGALGELTGRGVGEDVVERVFAGFCLGK